jgi:selenocysteine-specific elongation factor
VPLTTLAPLPLRIKQTHDDSGKTSIVAALSSTLSTAALDKHPQSRARGITLDLGFSAFTVAPPLPPGHACAGLGAKPLQFTLVDCPGHASLIRTVIGGARIIDVMVLVVDAAKGFCFSKAKSEAGRKGVDVVK